MGSSTAQACRREGGYTVVELLTAATMFVFVLTATLTLYATAAKDQARNGESVAAVHAAIPALERMTRDIRQASSLSPTSSSSTVGGRVYTDDITMTTYVRGRGFVTVRYDCSARNQTACERTEQGGSAYTVLTGLGHSPSSPGYFSWASGAAGNSPMQLVMRVLTPEANGPTQRVEIDDGICLRNGGGLCVS